MQGKFIIRLIFNIGFYPLPNNSALFKIFCSLVLSTKSTYTLNTVEASNFEKKMLNIQT